MKNRAHITLVLCLILFFNVFFGSALTARNYVKIAVNSEIPRINPHQEPQKLVEQVIEFWKTQLNKVLPGKPDLILLTEACDRPSGMSPEEQMNYYNVRKDQVKRYFASVAKENHCYIAFGTKQRNNDQLMVNSTCVLDRAGNELGVYDKNFPTVWEMESGIKASNEAPIINCDFGRVACAVCFDLNFPELLSKYQQARPDIILFSSMYHGGLVQSYWAYSCRSFFVASVGDRGVSSEIRNPLGEIVAATTNYYPYVVTEINLDCKLVHLDYNWQKLDQLKAKYGDEVTIQDPGKLGCVLVTSESPTVNVDQMLKEFGMENLDDYLDRSRKEKVKHSLGN